MKNVFFLLFFGLALVSYGQDPNFTIVKKVVEQPKMFQKKIELIRRTFYVHQDYAAAAFYSLNCKLNNGFVKNLRCFIDNDSTKIYSNDSTVEYFVTNEPLWVKNSIHTILVTCDVEYSNSSGCPAGDLVFSDTLVMVGDMVTFYPRTNYQVRIATAELQGDNYFSPPKVEKIDYAFVKVADVNFKTSFASVQNDKLILSFHQNDSKKVKNVMYVVDEDTDYVHSTQPIMLPKPDSLRTNETLRVQIFYQLDSSAMKLKDSIQATLELRSFDQCLWINELVLLPVLRIEQKIASTNGIKNKNYESNLKVYPNPAHDVINISNLPKDSKVFIIDMNGKSIDVVVLNNQIDISSLSPGMYFIQTGTTTLKLVKQ